MRETTILFIILGKTMRARSGVKTVALQMRIRDLPMSARARS